MKGLLPYRVYQLAWSAVDLVFPPICPGCEHISSRWCLACQQKTIPIIGTICECCGEPLDFEAPCSRCKSLPPKFTAARSFAVYQEPLRHTIHRLKYHGDGGLGDTLAFPLISLVKETGWSYDLVAPVPLGKQRYKERGYNQAAYLSIPLALYFGVPYRPDALRRVRETRSQVQLSPVERKENVQGAFLAEPRRVAEKAVLLVDDVMTTGATLNECAQALLDAGALAVYAITLARALGKSRWQSA